MSTQIRQTKQDSENNDNITKDLKISQDEETKNDAGATPLMENYPNVEKYVQEAKPKTYEANLIERINDGSVLLSYEGHITPEIQELLNELKEIDNPTYSDKLRLILHQLGTKIDNFFEKHLSSERFRMKFTKEDVLLWIFVLTIAIVYTVQLFNLQSQVSSTNSQSWVYTLFLWMTPLTLLGSILLLILLLIKWYSVVTIILLVALFGSSLACLITYLVLTLSYREEVSFSAWFNCIVVGGVSCVFFVLYSIFRLLEEKVSRISARLFIAILYGLCYYWIFYQILENVASTSSFSMTSTTIVSLIKNPVALIVEGIWIVIWTVIHKRYFYTNKARLYRILAKAMQRSLKDLSRGTELPSKPKELPKILRTLLKNSYLISNFTHCIIAMILLYLSITGLIESFSEEDTLIINIMTTVFVFVLLPFTLAFNFSIMPIRNKLLILPIIVMVSSIGTYYLQIFLNNIGTEWSSYGYLFQFGPAAYLIYMASLAMYTMIRKRYLYLIVAYGTLFILLPGYYIICYLPIQYSSNSSSYLTAGIIWFATGTSLFGLAFLIRFIYKFWMFCKKRVKRLPTNIEVENETQEESINSVTPTIEEPVSSNDKDQSAAKLESEQTAQNTKQVPKKSGENQKKRVYKKLDLSSFIYLDLKETGHWINTVAFAISYTIIVSFFWDMLEGTYVVSKSVTGLMYGILAFLPIVFIGFNFVLRVQVSKLSKHEIDSISYKIMMLVRDEGDVETRKTDRLRKIEGYILIFGVLVIPGVLIAPAIIISSSEYSYMLQTLLGCSIVYSIILIGLIEFKKVGGKYHRFLTPMIVFVAWLTIIIPFGVTAPVLFVISGNTTEAFFTLFEDFLFIGGLEFIIGVTILAIIINVILNKAELEKKARYIVKRVLTSLKKNAVKADFPTVRRIYDQYLVLNDEDNLKMRLEDGYPVFWWNLSENEPDYNYRKILVTKEAYVKLLKRGRAKKIVEKKGCCGRLKEWLFGKDKEDEMFGEANFADLKMLDENHRWKVDDYFPKDYTPEQIFKPLDEIFENEFLSKLKGMGKKGRGLTKKASAPVNLEREHDFERAGVMLPKLEELRVFPLNREDYVGLLKSSQKARETFIKHLYDYATGSLTQSDKMNAQGLLFRDYVRFLELAGTSELKNPPDYQALYRKYAFLRESDGTYTLSLDDFKHSLIDIGEDFFSPAKFQTKNLTFLVQNKFIRKTYQHIMINIPDISKNYRINLRLAAGEMGDFNDVKFKSHFEHGPGEGAEGQIAGLDEDKEKINREKYLAQRQDNYEKEVENTGNRRSILTEEAEEQVNLEDTALPKRIHQMETLWKKLCKCCYREKAKSKKGGVSFTKRIENAFSKFAEAIGFDVVEPDEDPEDDLYNLNQIRRACPPWSVVVENTVSTIHDASIEYEKFIKKESLTLSLSTGNITAIISKVTNLYGMCGYAFRSGVGWFSSDSAANTAVSVVTGDFNGATSFFIYFWSSFAITIVFLILARLSFKKVREGTLGLDKSGKKASFPNREFFRATLISVFASSLFTTASKSLLNSLACIYETNEGVPVLITDTSLVCLEPTHVLYLIFGIVSLMLYYPLCCIIYPSFQFQNKSLDIKYEPYFIVIVVQFNFFISQSATFFYSSDSADITPVRNQLITHFSLFVGIALLNYFAKPCLVRKMNVWDTAIYSIGAVVNTCSIVVLYTGNSYIGLALIIPGVILPLVIAGYVYRKYYIKVRIKGKAVRDQLKYSKNKVIPENLDLEMALQLDKERWDQYHERQNKDMEQKTYENKALRLF